MKRVFCLIPVIFLLFAQCKKDEQPIKVVYSFSERSTATPLVTITYVSDKNGTTATSSSSSSSWSSSPCLLERGQYVSMKVECSDPTFDIKFGVYVNGWPFQEMVMQSPNQSETISGYISQ